MMSPPPNAMMFQENIVLMLLRRIVLMFLGRLATTLSTSFVVLFTWAAAELWPEMCAEMFPRLLRSRFHMRYVRTSRRIPAAMCQRKYARIFLGRSVLMFQVRFARMSPGRNAETNLRRCVT